MDAIKSFFNDLMTKVIEKFKAASLFVKVPAAIIALLLIFFIARIGLFGDALLELTHRVYDGRIPIIDPEQPAISIDFALTTHRDGAEVPILREEPCFSGEIVKVSVAPSHQSWLVVFGMDGQAGAYPVSDPNFSSKLVSADQKMTFDVKLDEVEGTEAFLVLFSPRRFSLEEVQLQKIEAELFKDGGKGGQATNLRLDFGDALAVSAYTCRHMAK